MKAMALPSNVYDEVGEIEKDTHRGARELTVVALEGLRRSIKQFQASNEQELTGFLLTAARAFAQARPSMISITNSMSTVAYDVLRHAVVQGGLRECVLHMIDEQLTRLEKAFGNVISNAANLVKHNSTVITCSYSSTVLETLIGIGRTGRSFKVLALPSPSLNESIEYGVLMCERLHDAGIRAAVIGEEMIEKHVRFVDIALVGADSILPDGSVINGSPTLRLARESSNCNKQFCVASETWKINPLPLLGIKPPIEKGMERIPSDLVTTFATEDGLIAPKDICSYARKFSKRLRAIQDEWRLG